MRLNKWFRTTLALCLLSLTTCATESDNGSNNDTQSDDAESACEEMKSLILLYPVDETEDYDEFEPCITSRHFNCEAALACLPDNIESGFQVMDCLFGASRCAAQQCETTLSCLTDEFADGESSIIDALKAAFDETCIFTSVATGPAGNGEARVWEIDACVAGTCINAEDISGVVCK